MTLLLDGTPEQRCAAALAVFDDALARGATRREASRARHAFIHGEPAPVFETLPAPLHEGGLTSRPVCIVCGVQISVEGGHCRDCYLAERWAGHELPPITTACDRCGGALKPRRMRGPRSCPSCAANERWRKQKAEGVVLPNRVKPETSRPEWSKRLNSMKRPV